MTIIDTHSHIDMEDFNEDFDAVLQRAKEAGVEKIIIPAAEAASFDRIIQLIQTHDEIYGALGIHPSEAAKTKEEDFEKIIELGKNKKIIAIGECGLDYYWDKNNIEAQKKLFLRQIKIANELNKPILIHDREAHKDCFDILTIEAKTTVIMHCFSGSLEFAKECIKKGFYIALGGVVTFKNAKKTHEVAKEIPLEYLLLETDAPYLTPEPHRGERNEPAYTKFTAQKIAELRECSFDEIAEKTTQNAKKVFGF